MYNILAEETKSTCRKEKRNKKTILSLIERRTQDPSRWLCIESPFPSLLRVRLVRAFKVNFEKENMLENIISHD